MGGFNYLRTYYRCKNLKSGLVCFILSPAYSDIKMGKVFDKAISLDHKEDKSNVRAC